MENKNFYAREYLRDYVLGVYGDMDVERIHIDMVIEQAIKDNLFSAIDWRDTHTYLCAPLGDKPVCVERVLGVLSVLLEHENEQFITKEFPKVKLNTDDSYHLLARLQGLDDYVDQYIKKEEDTYAPRKRK